jgi:hypothetical protein
MELYSGLDLHSRNTYIGILDTDFKHVFKKRISNNLDLILETLQPFRAQLKGLVVESTYNWYWLVDGLMDAGYGCVHLANPSAIKQYEGLKHSDDQHDAFFLAQLLILGILPQGYIYPKEDRPVRDLARKRMFLVKHKTAHILSLQSLIARCCNQRVSSNQLRTFTRADLEQLLKEEHLVISAQANLDSISFLKQQIHGLEKVIKNKLKLSQAFNGLLTKSKGSGNRKNGNRYLSWAFSEAAQMSRRYNQRFRRYYDRKAAQTNTIVATRALSNKLARICYYIMRDQVVFNEELILH